MPRYSYKCEKCEKTKTVFFKTRKKEVAPECSEHGKMKKTPGNISSAIVTKKVDNVNKHVKRDVKEDLKKRSHDHFVKNIMPELIEKEGTDMAEKYGWIKKDGKRKKLVDEK